MLKIIEQNSSFEEGVRRVRDVINEQVANGNFPTTIDQIYASTTQEITTITTNDLKDEFGAKNQDINLSDLVAWKYNLVIGGGLLNNYPVEYIYYAITNDQDYNELDLMHQPTYKFYNSLDHSLKPYLSKPVKSLWRGKPNWDIGRVRNCTKNKLLMFRGMGTTGGNFIIKAFKSLNDSKMDN